MTRTTRIDLPFGIVISTTGDTTTLVSNLLTEFSDPDDDREVQRAAEASCDAMESLLLALFAAGADLDTSAAREAIETSVEAIANYL